VTRLLSRSALADGAGRLVPQAGVPYCSLLRTGLGGYKMLELRSRSRVAQTVPSGAVGFLADGARLLCAGGAFLIWVGAGGSCAALLRAIANTNFCL
jgi:hypothetical protein